MLSFLLAGFWILFGIQTNELAWLLAGAAVSLVAFIFFLTKVGINTLTISRLTLVFTTFVFVLVARSFWLIDSYGDYRLLLIASIGILFLIVGENVRRYPAIIDPIQRSVVIASFGLVGLWLMATIFDWGIEVFGPDSLVVYGSYYHNHNHLGDFLILAVLLLSVRHKRIAVLLLIPMIASLSRSAVLSLAVGVGYLLFNRTIRLKKKFGVIVVAVVLSLVFIAMSLTKVTLDSRQFFIQSIEGLMDHPFGVGLGEFATISASSEFVPQASMKDYSSNAHSIVFEWISGVGWLSLLGIGWLALTTWKMGVRTKSPSQAVFRGLWWAMLIPMLFDTVYVIPSYWWLWMLMTGLGLEKDTRELYK
jgi:hypothetical protein